MSTQATKKRKKYYAIDGSISIEMIIGWIVLTGISFGLSIFFLIHFVLRGENSGWVLVAMMIVPTAAINIYMVRNHFWSRYLLNYTFDEDGIHCGGLGWRRFIVPWSSIHTYGFADTSYATVSFCFFYFSKDPGEMYSNTKDIAALRKDRLILQHRVDAWEAVKEYMPADMKRNLEDCLRHNREGCFRR